MLHASTSLRQLYSTHITTNDVNKTTSLKTKTKTKTTESKTKTKTKTTESKTKTKVGNSNTKTKTNVIAADNVIINGKVAIIASLYSTILCMFSQFFIITFCVVCM